MPEGADGVLAVMGSGETSPTMVTIHRALAGRLGPGHPPAVLLETPYGFQTNVADISATACGYFARSVGLPVVTAPGLRGGDTEADRDRGLRLVRGAGWLFCGPGSPSYALRQWHDDAVGAALHDRFRSGTGLTVFASAAAATLGRFTVPVYEVYKVGADPHWLDGLDVLSHLGLDVAVVPHYDNKEGGTHDTRYCYLGEQRLRSMEEQLPPDVAVVGVDEHTAVVVDPGADRVTVLGRGTLTVRHHGRSVVLPSGTALTMTELRDLCRRKPLTRTEVPAPAAPPGPAPATLDQISAECEQRFDKARDERDAPGMTRAVLALEAAVREWAADTEEDIGVDQARAVLRTMIVRLGEAAAHGVAEPATVFRPVVEPLLALRARLRAGRDYRTADDLRDALAAAGIQLSDGPGGTSWSVTATAAG
ncbi:hypothetical protein JIG36_01455 [Actinoplanes sp. LDG1-06]|uniref:Cysteinyl-tRNA synthetase n=1 Tax=Paractinoplanes ovalisporus TaxID=2810368 RepID=A0ABS2A313_9ACTN|nr:hypothetical protein [Actinoplanes ovalisporus]MBM2614221.1 hypothetical protein [Actinoplanes ovalisporus]